MEREAFQLHLHQPVLSIRVGRHSTDRQPALLKERLRLLTRLRGAKTVERWCEFIDGNRWEEFVQDLLVNHYDPTYGGAEARWAANRLASYTLDALTPTHLDSFVSRLGEDLQSPAL